MIYIYINKTINSYTNIYDLKQLFMTLNNDLNPNRQYIVITNKKKKKISLTYKW